MEEKSGARISRKAFIHAAGILLSLMIIAGLLARLIPAGQYCGGVRPGITVRVFPTCVGVNRTVERREDRGARFPHTRGGESI